MKDNLLEFYTNKYNFSKDTDKLDLNFIPPIQRRRLGTLDKIAVANLNSVYSDNIQNIVFSSQYGEVERLMKLISQYTENKEVSPNIFSGSVHNYPAGFFLLNKQNPIPYTSISACEHSISMGLLSSVTANYDNTLFCYADTNNGQTNALAINLTKIPAQESVKYIIKPENNEAVNDEFDSFIKLLNGEINSLKTSIYTIERSTK